MMEPIVAVPEVPVCFVAHFLVSHNVTLKVRFDCSARKNKFTVNIPFMLKKTMSMLLIELWTCCAFFVLHDWGLFHCDDCCFVSGS
jgi:hypothetical protein